MNISIKSLAKEDQPIYKLASKGLHFLTNTELLSIVINKGTKELSALDLAKILLIKADNKLQNIGTMTLQDLINLKIKGLGRHKASQILAALEMGLRRQVEDFQSIFVTSSTQIANYLKEKYQHYQKEILIIILLARNNKIIKEEIIAEGGLTSTIIDLRLMFRLIFIYKATAFIVCHNHPSGNIKNSHQDNVITNKIREGAKLLDITFFDHIIIGKDGHFSYADNNLI